MNKNNEKLNTQEERVKESEKNEHEPAYYKIPEHPAMIMTPERAKFLGFDLNELEALYTNPPQPKPLTDNSESDDLTAASMSGYHDGKKAERKSWVFLSDEDRKAVFESLPDMLDGFLKKWGWLHFAKGIEEKCRELNEAPPGKPFTNSADWSTEIKDGRVKFRIGVQSFTIDYDEEDYSALVWMEKQLHKALSSMAGSRCKPLTDEKIAQILKRPDIAEHSEHGWRILPYAFAKAIQEELGIKE